MKKGVKYIVIIVVLLILNACDNFDKVPEYKENIEKPYVLPPPSPLTMEEREYVARQIDEYEKLIKR